MQIRFTVEDDGPKYLCDIEEMTLEQAIIIQKETGLTIGMIQPRLTLLDAQAVAAVVWLGKQQAGEAFRWKDLAGLKPFKVKSIPIDDEPEKDAHGEELGEEVGTKVDPTPSGGRTRKASTTATS